MATSTDLANKVDKTTTVNGHALSTNVTVSASDITTGTLPVAQVDTGTTANKIVKLDASAKLPAVDGSQLTNLPIGTGNVSQTSASGSSGRMKVSAGADRTIQDYAGGAGIVKSDSN